MLNRHAKAVIEKLLNLAEINLNGNQPWDIKVHNPNFYARILKNPNLTLGETYMDAWWDCEQLDQFFFRIIRADLEETVKKDPHFLLSLSRAKMKFYFSQLINYQSKTHAFEIGEHHYDMGNQLYQFMLDDRMNYSCGYWKNSDNLNDAQVAKLDLTCRKLQLQPGMKVLDIGCGWGAFAKYAAERYQVQVKGITVSKEQLKLARELCQGLPVEVTLQDYRDLNEQFDRICSIGMFEHVGYKNYMRFMQTAQRCLKENGIFLLHTIGNNYTSLQLNEWINKYIFPNGVLPSIQQIGKAIEKHFVMEDWHNFGSDYDKTLMAWHANFNRHWQDLKSEYNEHFQRMWNYYLLACAGTFRARAMQLWQIVLTKQGMLGGYASVR